MTGARRAAGASPGARPGTPDGNVSRHSDLWSGGERDARHRAGLRSGQVPCGVPARVGVHPYRTILVYFPPFRLAPAISPAWPNTTAITGDVAVVVEAASVSP